MAAGHRHSLALNTSGQVYSWGYGGRPGLWSVLPFLQVGSPVGFGEGGDVSKPRVIESIKEKVKQIAAGNDLSLALG